MKYFSLGVSVLSLVIVLGYIQYNEGRQEEYLTRYEASENAKFPYQPNARTLPLPENLTFAGEEVPLDQPEVRDRLMRELLVNTYWHSNTLLMITQANRWLPSIEAILIAEGVPRDFKYLPVIEGSLRNDVSYAGAVGFWQLLKGAAQENGLEVNDQVDERYHPLKSTEAAAGYIKRAYRSFENWTNVAASYNRGVAGLKRAMRSQKSDDYYKLYLNEQTSRYVFRILAMKVIMENPEDYGFDIDEDHLFDPVPTKEIFVDETISSLPQFAQDMGITYGTLRYLNPWLRDYRLNVSKGEQYTFLVPEYARLAEK